MRESRSNVSRRLAVMAVGFALAACSESTPVVAPSALAPEGGPQLAIGTPFNNAGQCMSNDVATFGSGPVNCTANDIRIARADVSQVDGNVITPNSPIQCTPGTNVTITMTAVLEATSNSQRDDIGVWIATDGGDAKTGQCRHYNLVVGSPGTVNEAPGGTADACAGMQAGAQTTLNLDTFTIPCNPVTQPDGSLALKIGSCLSWKVPGQDELCPRGFTTPQATYTADDFRAATIPGTPAKCNCEGFTIPVQVVSSITIVKNAIPDNAQSFAFTATGAGMSAFSLVDNGGGAAATKVFSGLVNDGSARTVTESALPTGWSLTGLSCTSSGGTSTISTSSATATITLRGGENVTCTYTNTASASLDVEKQTVGGTGSFDFTNTGTGLTNFSRSTATNNPSQTAPISFSGATVAGDKFVQETGLPAGWSITNISCTANGATIVIGTGGSGAFAAGATSGYDTGDNTVKVTLAPGSSPSCVFTNTLAATITVSKICVGGTGPSFPYTGTTPSGTLAPFSLTCGQSSQAVLTSTAFGTYTVTEGLTNNWDLTSLQCTGGGGNTSTSGAVATIGLDAGENVTCTYTNTKRGAITITKVTNPASDPQDFAFTTSGTGLSNFSLDTDAGDGTIPNTRTFSSLVPGSYTVTEGATTGWDLTNLTCVDPTNNSTVNVGTGVASINVAAGETVSCTYTNTKRGTVIIKKETDPDGAPGAFPFTQNVDGTGAFNLSDNGSKTFPNVLPNTGTGYTVTEGATTGFSLKSLVCDNPDGLNTSTVAGSVATIRVNAGETVTCTYTNRQLASLSVLKVENGALPLSFAWQFQLRTGASAGVAGTIVANASANVTTGVVQFPGFFVPGAYQLCEVGMLVGFQNNLTGFTPGVDNSEECVNITLAPGANGPGGILNVPNPIDNIRPPGGDARTIGYWSNWSSCSKGNQWTQALKRDIWNKTLDGNLPQTLGLLVLDGATGENLEAADCLDAFNILRKSSLDGTKRASDPAYNMAAQLLAAMLNYTAGAKQCAAATTAINAGKQLLTDIGFTGTGSYKDTMTAQQISDANSLANTLDQYNNNLLCP